ncbi:hypothetical protein Tco_1078570 [Tanacetum coccineum]|uniref:Retrotransposon gag domain-containing protein n=1 Tax=Tanacetum coccineum TaxID=301880 RepID=A0ABQ5HPF9_9ASTR
MQENEVFQDMQLIQKLRNDQKCMKKVVEDMSGKMIMAGENIDNLTMEQYLMLTRENQAPGVVRPEIRGNVNFEIKCQVMHELREDTFLGNKNDDAHEHIEWVLDIVSLFNIPRVTRDAVMLRVFLITLTRAAKRSVDRLIAGTINTWDLLKKAFIQRYCPPSKTAKQLEDICNLKQEGEDTLYQAWKRYNDLLYKCPNHDINSHQKVNIFYNGLSTINRQLQDSHGPIPGMTPAEGLTAIQTMADHSQKWHDGSLNQCICSSNNSEGMAVIECPLNEDAKSVKEVKYGEGCSLDFNGTKYHVRPPEYYTRVDNRPPKAELGRTHVQALGRIGTKKFRNGRMLKKDPKEHEN